MKQLKNLKSYKLKEKRIIKDSFYIDFLNSYNVFKVLS